MSHANAYKNKNENFFILGLKNKWKKIRSLNPENVWMDEQTEALWLNMDIQDIQSFACVHVPDLKRLYSYK